MRVCIGVLLPTCVAHYPGMPIPLLQVSIQDPELTPEFVLNADRFHDLWDDAHMNEVVKYLSLDRRLVVPDEWKADVLAAISNFF